MFAGTASTTIAVVLSASLALCGCAASVDDTAASGPTSHEVPEAAASTDYEVLGRLLDKAEPLDSRLAQLEALESENDQRAIRIINAFVEQYRSDDVLMYRAVLALGELGDNSSVHVLHILPDSLASDGRVMISGKLMGAVSWAKGQCSRTER